MYFQQLEVGPMKNLVYLIGCPNTKEAAVIDCGFEAARLQQTAERDGYRIKKIFLTHVHYDHSGAADELARQTGATIFAHRDVAQKRDRYAERGMWIIPEHYSPLADLDQLPVGDIAGSVIASPGHQNDHLLFLFPPYLFTGDTLFIGAIGRTDFADSSSLKMTETLNKIVTLSDEYIICPGHDYGSYKTRKLGEEKKDNPYLQELN